MKILLIRTSSIGDIVLCSKAIRCLRKKYPFAEIDFLTKASFQEIVQENPAINNVMIWESKIQQNAQLINNGNYDVVVDWQDNLKTRWLELQTPIRIKWLRYNKFRLKRQWSVWTKRNFYPPIPVPEQYLAALQTLLVEDDGEGLNYFIAKKEQISKSDLPFTHMAGFGAICLSATHFTKKMPQEKWEELIQKLSIPLILIGGEAEKSEGDLLAAIDEFKVINRCGKYSLGQSASVIQQAKFVITHDTGMMHIAAAFQKKTFSIWGGTVPYLGFSPYQLPDELNFILENKSLSCRPCSKYGRASCPKKHFKCMNELNLDIVIDKAVCK